MGTAEGDPLMRCGMKTHLLSSMTTTTSKRRESIIASLTTPELATEALKATTTKWNHRGMGDLAKFEPLWCLEKVDQRGFRHKAEGRAARPMINVRDGEAENVRKNAKRKADGATTGVITCTKYLATHVMLYANKRPIPRQGFHASHLCQNQKCLRSTHIRVESELLNQRRKGCPGILVCSECNFLWQACKHHEHYHCLTVTHFVCCNPSHPQRLTTTTMQQSVTDEIQ